MTGTHTGGAGWTVFLRHLTLLVDAKVEETVRVHATNSRSGEVEVHLIIYVSVPVYCRSADRKSVQVNCFMNFTWNVPAKEPEENREGFPSPSHFPSDSLRRDGKKHFVFALPGIPVEES